MSTITMGVDLAKSVFAVCTVDAAGRVLARQEFERVLPRFCGQLS